MLALLTSKFDKDSVKLISRFAWEKVKYGPFKHSVTENCKGKCII